MNYDYDRSLGRVLRSACFALSLLHERSRDTDQGYCYVLYIYVYRTAYTHDCRIATESVVKQLVCDTQKSKEQCGISLSISKLRT